MLELWLTEQLYDVDHITHVLGWNQFTLLGHSMGGAISAMYAGTFPEKISALCLIEGIVPIQENEERACEHLRLTINQRAALMKKSPPPEPTLASAEKKLISSNPALTPASARLLLQRGAIACENGYQFTRDLRVRLPSALRPTETMVNSFIKRISCNAMLIIATNGHSAVVGDRERRQVALLERTTTLETLTVPGTHHVHMNEPEVVGPHVARFLAATASAKPVVKPADDKGVSHKSNE